MIRFVLASASPARLRTLLAAGLPVEVMVSDFDEASISEPTPVDLVRTLATRKAETVAARVRGAALVLGCDSLLELDDGRPYGKPASAEDAVARWQRMRGTTGQLHTGHCLIRTSDGASVVEVASTTVRFGRPSDDEIERYVASGEPAAVAGAFTIDGLGGWFTDSVSGDHHTVVGVSLPLLRRMILAQGFTLAELGYPATR